LIGYRIAAFCALAGLTALGADAAPAVSQAPPRIFQFALQNGMQVLVIPDHRAPIVTQMLWFRAGAADDPPGVSGVAHFFEHMMFRGTKAVPGDQYSQTIARNGGESNAFTTHDYTAFYEQVARDRLKTVMGLEADRMANLDLSDANVSTERDVVLAERRLRVDDDPEALVQEQMEAALHLSHPYGRPVLGWPDEIRHIDRAAAQDFYKHRYAPNNALLIVAGDVQPNDIRVLAQDQYGKLTARELMPRSENAEPPRLAETRMDVVRADAKVAVFSRIYRVPSYAQAAPEQAEALDLLAQLMGGDASAALYRILVVDKKLATDAGASYSGMVRDAGEFSVYAVPRPGVSPQTLERAVDAIIDGFMAGPPRAADLQRAKTQLVAGTVYRRDSQYALASAYGEALMIGLTVDDVNEWPSRIRAVSADTVRKAAALLLKREAVSAWLLPEAHK
jgi:zinc protease